MAIIGSIALILFLGAVFAPQFWVQHTMKRHAGERADFPGTGGELARHLLDHFNIDGVGVEETEKGDHYDPATRTVRLSKDNYAKSSLTAVAVAAHEVGHAIQHYRDESGLKRRQRMVSFAMITDKFASIFFIAAPILTVIVRSPAAFLGMVVIGIALLAIRVVVHLVTLPVEYDASFNKALPILREGGYLHQDDMKGARAVLKAAAFTYVAAALMSLLNLARWVRFLR